MTALSSPRPSDGRGDGQRLRRALIASVVLHVLIFTGMNLQFRFRASPGFSEPIQMVELAGGDGGRRAAPAAVREAPKPPPAPKAVPVAPPKAAPQPKAVAVKAPAPPPLKAPVVAEPPPKAVTVPVEAPVKKAPPAPEYTAADTAQKLARMRQQYGPAEPAEPEKTADVRGAIEDIRKRVVEAPAKPAPKPQAPSAGEGPAGVVGGGAGAGALAAMRSTAYRNQLWSHVKQSWAVPPSLQGARLQTVVGVRIDRFGTVKKTWVETGSGSEAFDQSALRAVGRASPLPPVPKDVPDDDFEDGLFFRFRE